MRIVIVDDNLAMGEAYRRVLEKAGYEVEYFSNGASALQSLIKSPAPQLILVDCSMPGESGEDFLVRLEREYPEIYTNLRIVGLSSFPEDSVMVQTFSNKVDQFVEKPDDAQGLVPVVQKLLKDFGI